ncbi:MAG: PAS domain S-box protein [Thermoflexales bacterium]|nr:PAS domain S-box protein [Thermoflexales bacterium]
MTISANVAHLLVQVVDATSDAVLIIDGGQNIIYANHGVTIVFGHDAASLIGQPLDLLLPARYQSRHAALVRGFGEAPEQARRMGERRDIVGVRQNGEEFPAEAGITRITEGGETYYSVILRDISDRRRRDEELRLKSNQLAVMSERTRLARDLHDAVTQSLFSASIMAELLPQTWERDLEAGRRQLEDIRRLNRSALAEMRSLLIELRPSALTESRLSDLIRQLANASSSRLGIQIDVQADEQTRLPGDVQVAFYRIAQESLHNVAKHSRATEASIQINTRQSGAMMLIHDNGTGFNLNAVAGTNFGLRIMRERAAEIGAALDIDSAVGTGTDILLTWEWQEK